jgi:hypothetical protein
MHLPTYLFHKWQHVFIVEHYLQSQSYVKCKDDFSSAFPKSQVPYKSTVFHSVACFHETGSVSEWKCSGHPTILNDVSGENIWHSLVQSPWNSFKKTGSTDWTILQKCAKSYKEIRISSLSYSSCVWAEGPWQKIDFNIVSVLNTSNEMVWLF